MDIKHTYYLPEEPLENSVPDSTQAPLLQAGTTPGEESDSIISEHKEQKRLGGRSFLEGNYRAYSQVGITAILMILSFIAGSFSTQWMPALAPGLFPISSAEPASARKDFGVFWQVWNLIELHYVDRQAIKPKDMIYGAIRGMIETLGDNRHTRFLTPEELKNEQEGLSGHFTGIGLFVTSKNGRPVVNQTIPGAPADKAGLRHGDTIIKINGIDTLNRTQDQNIALIRGTEGTTVHLTVQRPEREDLLEFAIKRGQIKEPSVTWHLIAPSQIADIQIISFSANTEDELKTVLKTVRKQGVKGIILDLRDDRGGYLSQSVDTSSQFLKSGTVVLQQDRSGHRTPLAVKGGGLATSLPIVVLVNHDTASAAEIFAGAIQDNGRGLIIGQPTFGTGTLLDTFNLSDGSAILLGTSEWLTPNGHFIKNKGITPNILLALPVGADPLTPPAETDQTRAQILASKDTQLVYAVKYLEKELHLTPAVAQHR